MSAILRQSYLEKIERYLGKDTIIILTGQRLARVIFCVSSGTR